MHLSELRIFTEPQQGATYDQLLAVARQAERLGFGAFFRSDHFLKMGDVTGQPGPTDAWITLAGIARETTSIRLGTLVTSATFRHPGPLAISVSQVDQMSGGRVELGIGAGWFEQEHTAYGIPFPPLGERFDRLEEQLTVITGMWATPAAESYEYHGRYYDLKQSPALPKPVQSPSIPVIIGGHGPKRTPALAARFAGEFNLAFSSIETFTTQRDRVAAAAETIGRDPLSIVNSVAQIVCVGSSEAEFAQRAAVLGREPDELRRNGIAGTVEEAAERIRNWNQAGATRMYLQVLDLSDSEHLDLIAEMVIPLTE